MNIYRYEENPLITPEDVKPHHDDFEVIGAFNAGVTIYKDEVIMLLRVAERPITKDTNKVMAPIYNHESDELEIIELDKSNPVFDFSDSRTIREKGKLDSFVYLTSLSYLRIARSKDGHQFTVDPEPFIYPSNKLERFGIEDPRITKIGGYLLYLFQCLF
ncbi:glycoside hydrolase [Gracilibacillus boraciitolerans JCM 21714]|uniref:Glycoside hydrolase n=1 Tax=Gracilibacillus boraciitolerans JCM 21714 TaxID=1298598 RepID=W4VKJ4_9BACI|nr:glycoside hydrolase [Gracilibacillus boraciitolerans JCM 21714]